MPTNADRRRRASRVLTFASDARMFQYGSTEPLEERITDLITDLLHLADLTYRNAEATMDRAVMHYQEEVDLERAGIE